MKTLTGTVYRAPSGYWHNRGATIADVLTFEREELGNDDKLPDVPEAFLQEPAIHCTWVTIDHETAERYGEEVIELELKEAIIIASDGCGGLLMYSKNSHC